MGGGSVGSIWTRPTTGPGGPSPDHRSTAAMARAGQVRMRTSAASRPRRCSTTPALGDPAAGPPPPSVGDNPGSAMAALFLLVTIFFWGTAFRASAIGVEHTSPIMLTALRAAPAALVLLAALLVVRGRLPSRPLWGITTITGLLMVTLTLE